MAEYNKERYYWIRLTDRFMTSDTVDFLMSQPNGAQYVVLYQMLCLKTVNQGGVLSRTLGEIIVPYDVQKIVRDLKYFTFDTVTIALDLFKKLGLIYEQTDGALAITDFDKIVGSQTISAEKKQEQRRLQGGQMSTPMSPICPPDKEKEKDKERDKDKDIDIDDEEKDNNNSARTREDVVVAVKKYSINEIMDYCRENAIPINGDEFTYFVDRWDIVLDTKVGLGGMDFKAINLAYENSEWLRYNFPMLSKIIKHYIKIVSGQYNDGKRDPHAQNRRVYTPKELNKLITNFDDLEF